MIDNIYMNKYQYSTNTIYYQKARFFRETGTNKHAYCVEPFAFFNDNGNYTPTIKVDNLTEEQANRIKNIAYFGYGYLNHTDLKWYAITQMLIWQTADPNSGSYYFTDSLNGNRIDIYQNEMNEIMALVTKYEDTPILNNLNYTFVENNPIILNNMNSLINYYQTDNKDIIISNNTITIPKKEVGEYSYDFYSNKTIYNEPIVFYQSSNSQNLIRIGNNKEKKVKLNIKVISTSIEITKIDKDTNGIIPSGEASLNGAKYKLYDKDMNEINEYEVINNKILINNLSFGKYHLKESTPGIGYQLNDNIYELLISEDTPNISCIVDNKVIEKNIIIKKLFGDISSLESENNVSFEIRNNDNILIDIITTDESGYANIILPYGTYTITQINSKEGYQIVQPFSITVDNTNEELIELKDFKIPVPNTSNKLSIWEKILEIIFFFL